MQGHLNGKKICLLLFLSASKTYLIAYYDRGVKRGYQTNTELSFG